MSLLIIQNAFILYSAASRAVAALGEGNAREQPEAALRRRRATAAHLSRSRARHDARGTAKAKACRADAGRRCP